MIGFLLDEDGMVGAVVLGLRRAGMRVETIEEHRRRGDSDSQQIEFAHQLGLVLFTFNRGDLIRIHTRMMRTGGHHSGLVIAVQQRHGIGDLIRRLVRISAELSAEEMHDRLEFLSDWPA